MAARLALFAALASALCVAFVLGYWPVRLWKTGWIEYMADDAFFYFVIAKNIATHGLSSFDGIVLTNGYQPLWQGMMALQYALVPGSFAATVFVELVMVASAAFLAFRAAPASDAWCLPLFAALIVATIDYPLVLDGMETSVLFLAFSVFMLALRHTLRSGDSWLPMALAGGLVIAARIDAAFFVLAALVIVPVRWRQSFKALALVAVAGALYLAINKVVFDAWLPVSGSAKMLGSFKINRVLVQQLASHWTGEGSPLQSVVGFVRSPEGRTLCLAAVTTALVVLVPRREGFSWRLGLAMVVGFVPFALRLLLLSSWEVWEWYNFPTFFLLVASLLMIAALPRAPTGMLGGWITRLLLGASVVAIVASSTILTMRDALLAGVAVSVAWCLPLVLRRGALMAQGITAVVGLFLLVVTATTVMRQPPHYNPTIGLFSRPLAEKVTEAIGTQRVAMADRAGAFAYFYQGSVSQLEGLVNDQRYLQALAKREPVEPLLCSRGVRHLVSYEVDLGDYTTHVVHPFRPYLTSFEGPTFTVSKADEVAKITDATRYGVRDRDNVVYVWRLTCAS
jgi:hypothetical protein